MAWISRARISSYKSFDDTGWIDFSPGFNLVVGANNSGKSALLRALSPPLDLRPHRNEHRSSENATAPSIVDLDISSTFEELRDCILQVGGNYYFPQGGVTADFDLRADDFFKQSGPMVLRMRRTHDKTIGRDGVSIDGMPPVSPHQSLVGVINGEVKRLGRVDQSQPDTLPSAYDHPTSGRFYHFDAQRMNVGQGPIADVRKLERDASNLPSVLNWVRGRLSPTFKKIESHLFDIIGGIESITIVQNAQSFEILTWIDGQIENENLGFPLNDSGTGVAQCLAILTAAATSKNSIIVIDEINSFLHPAACKRLIEILSTEYHQHQYIISTHSSDVISSAPAKKIYLTVKDRFKSTLKNIDPSDLREMRELSFHVGISMSDALVSDKIVWVEGQTEEVCFPKVLQHANIHIKNLRFSAISSTGIFTKKRRSYDEVVKSYKNIAGSLTPLLTSMKFTLDRETLNDDRVLQIESSCDNNLKFLPRRSIENYFLNCEVIASYLSEKSQKHISERQVREIVFEHLSIKCDSDKSRPYDYLSDPVFLKTADSAYILKKIFTDLSNHTIQYDKIKDGFNILSILLEHHPNDVSELTDFVKLITCNM